MLRAWGGGARGIPGEELVVRKDEGWEEMYFFGIQI
jgi:hypothetical protein